MNTNAQNNQIRMANDALTGMPDTTFAALVQDRALAMNPEDVERLSRRLGTIAHHKQRGDLDQVLLKAGAL